MFCCARKNPETIESMASILILGGVIPLCVALVSQYAFGLAPCHFCLAQRYPYLLVIAAGALSLFPPRGGQCWRFLVALGFFGLLATALIALAHTGIERGWLHYRGDCVAQAPADHSLEALRAAIASAPLVSCNAVMAEFLGLSMATWNALWAAFVALLAALQYRFDTRRHVR
jgi:disulfide bond formation protein DsbB